MDIGKLVLDSMNNLGHMKLQNYMKLEHNFYQSKYIQVGKKDYYNKYRSQGIDLLDSHKHL